MLKKAQESVGTPVSLVLIIAAIAVLAIIFFVYVAPNLLKLPDREICKTSVLAKSQTKRMGMESDLPLSCHTNFIDIKKDGIYRDGNIEVRFKRDEKPSEKEGKIKKYIAQEMYDCWYQFNEGKSDPWGDWHLGTTIHCMICADISFDSEFSEKITKIEDFGEFLNNEPVSKISKVKYSEYFGGKLDLSKLEIEGDEEDIYIDTSQPHLVLFTLHDAGIDRAVWMWTGGVCGPAIGLAIAGPLGWGAAGVGCALSFAGSGFRYVVAGKGGELQSGLHLLPSEAVNKKVCSRIG